MNKLVTVIVPTIGRPQYVKKTIESVLSQDYSHIEVLVSDNFTATPTKLILGEVTDSRIRFITRNHRHEFSEHMNLCIHDALGHYVIIISDDDLIAPDYISSMVRLFSEHQDVSVALGQQKILNDTDLELGEVETNYKTRTLEGLDFCQSHFQGKKFVPIFTLISLFARKEDVLSIGGFQPYSDGSHADNYLFFSLALKGRVGISNALMGYRVYLNSFGLSTSFDNLFKASLSYDKDMSQLVWGIDKLSVFKRLRLHLRIKISILLTLIYRLLRIYKERIGMVSTVINLLKVLVFFLPFNIFYFKKTTNKPTNQD